MNFRVTRSDVTDPDKLFRILTDFATAIAAINGRIDKIQPEATPPTPNVLNGVTQPGGALVQLGIDQMATKKSNLEGLVDPTTNDDSSQGYSRGSFWVNTVAAPKRIFFLRDATVTAADWQQI